MNYETIKVLICDDSVFARKALKQTLLSFGINIIIEATDGKDAVDKYIENKPDIVFMDIVMPKLTGTETLKAILAVECKAKVVMLYSFGTQENLKEAINIGACDFIQKPITDNKLRKFFKSFEKNTSC